MIEVDADTGIIRKIIKVFDTINIMSLLTQKFINSMHGGNSFPSLNGYSLFVFASRYNTEKYYGKVYKNELEYSFLNVRYNSKNQAFFTRRRMERVCIRSIQGIFVRSYIYSPC
jgi:hypothetical protein